MANKELFSSASATVPRTDTINEGGGQAHRFEPKHALAQLASTGCLQNTYYTDAKSQLDEVIKLAEQVDDEYLAKLAIYAREKAMMKDMPAALLVILGKRDGHLARIVFRRIVNNGRMLRNVFQMIRSGHFKIKTAPASIHKEMKRWFNEASVGMLMSGSIGNDPSLRDVLRMARPRPTNEQQKALFGWLVGKCESHGDLPRRVRVLEAFRKAETDDEQSSILTDAGQIRWDLLADSAKGPRAWRNIALSMGHQALRMNLNTLQRHGVLDSRGMVQIIAERLSDPESIRGGRQFPYQYFAAYMNIDDSIPNEIKQALSSAADHACGNIPEMPGPVLVGVDVSASMADPVTGRSKAPSKVRCVHVAALFAAAVIKKNPDSVVIPFDTQSHRLSIDSGDTILSIAKQLSRRGGGTNCSIPLVVANQRYTDRKFSGAIIISDNQSWAQMDNQRGSNVTPVSVEWNKFRKRQGGKLVLIDIQPYANTQMPDRDDVLNVGGFSDAVFSVVSGFLADDGSRFVRDVEEIVL